MGKENSEGLPDEVKEAADAFNAKQEEARRAADVDSTNTTPSVETSAATKHQSIETDSPAPIAESVSERAEQPAPDTRAPAVSSDPTVAKLQTEEIAAQTALATAEDRARDLDKQASQRVGSSWKEQVRYGKWSDDALIQAADRAQRGLAHARARLQEARAVARQAIEGTSAKSGEASHEEQPVQQEQKTSGLDRLLSRASGWAAELQRIQDDKENYRHGREEDFRYQLARVAEQSGRLRGEVDRLDLKLPGNVGTQRRTVESLKQQRDRAYQLIEESRQPGFWPYIQY